MNLPVKLRHIMILTGEPSGDHHGAALVQHMQQLDPLLYFSGIGGGSLKKSGVDLFYDIRHLSVMGVVEILQQFGKIREAFSLFRQKLKNHPPELIILVDYPGFNLKAAAFAKKFTNAKILYFIPPKVWAWRKSRLKQIKKYVHHTALIFPFEEKIYRNAGIPATYVGNPLADLYPEHENRLFASKKISNGKKARIIIGLLPGSRKTEIKMILPIMTEAARNLSSRLSDVHFLISRSGLISEKLIEHHLKKLNPDSYTIVSGPVSNIFKQADFLMAASGTVTLEAALCCIPTLLMYRMNPLTHAIARKVVKLKWVGLANLIVNQEVMPELLQDDASPESVTDKAIEMIQHLDQYQEKLSRVRLFLGRNRAVYRAAGLALNMI